MWRYLTPTPIIQMLINNSWVGGLDYTESFLLKQPVLGVQDSWLLKKKNMPLFSECRHGWYISDRIHYSAAAETGFNAAALLFLVFSLLLRSMIRWSCPGNSLKFAARSRFFTSSITISSRTTISTSNDAKAANGSAWENSRLVMAILLSVGRNMPLSLCSCGCSVPVFFLSDSAVASVLNEWRVVLEAVWFPELSSMSICLLAAHARLEPRKSRGCDMIAEFRSCSASWRWSESTSGAQRRWRLMLTASSCRTLTTSWATLVHGSRNSNLTDGGVLNSNGNNQCEHSLFREKLGERRCIEN